MKILVENLRNGNTRNEVKNQYMIFTLVNGDSVKIYQSYYSEILRWENGKLVRVGKDWNRSRTTLKYVKQLTGMNKKEIEKLIKEKFKYIDDIEAYSSI